jgi:hypothetical protein
MPAPGPSVIQPHLPTRREAPAEREERTETRVEDRSQAPRVMQDGDEGGDADEREEQSLDEAQGTGLETPDPLQIIPEP